jgi:hypothetical protein
MFGRIARWFAAGWAIAVFVGLLALPLYSVATTTSGTELRGSASLVSVNGPRVLFLVAVPVLASLLAVIPVPRAQRPFTIAAAAITCVVALLGAASVGLFFAPSAVALILAAALMPRG